VPSPTVAIRIPASVGPTTDAIWKFNWLRASAAGNRSRATSRGTADDRAGWSSEPIDAATKATAKRRGSGTLGWNARIARAALLLIIPSWVTRSIRRRSTASAIAPPPSEKTRMGTSWTRISPAIARVDPVCA
jgi:hypothetical protein